MQARRTLFGLVFGGLAAQVVGAAARLRVADVIGDGECAADEVAARCEAQPESTLRLLRALTALELLVEPRPGHFALTEIGALLRTDRPDSVDALARMFTDPAMVTPWQRLGDVVGSGRPVFDEVFGTDWFSYLGSRPELSALFNAAMSQGTAAAAAAIPAAYDFGRYGTIVDVGGGDGTLLAAILPEHRSARGILFDTAAGLAEAAVVLRRAGIDDRCGVVSGDFFSFVPGGGDLYVIKSVLHDWDDERAATILGHIRRTISDDGRVLIIEPVLPDTVDGSIPAMMYLSDINMMAILGGRERTRADFEALCRKAGFALTTVTPLPPPQAFCLIEAAPA